jgi:CrcB protein
MSILYVFMGGGLGSIARYGIGQLSMKYLTSSFPWGTFISNTLACILLGAVSYYLAQKETSYTWMQPFFIIGFCGGFSTFSTFSNETLQLINSGNYLVAAVNIVFSIAMGLASIYFFQRAS